MERLATLANQYIHKGSLIYIEGKLRSRQYEDKDGMKKYVTEILAEQLIMLDKKGKTPEKEIENENEAVLPFKK
jgi:single-strand DNA-binding protein